MCLMIIVFSIIIGLFGATLAFSAVGTIGFYALLKESMRVPEAEYKEVQE